MLTKEQKETLANEARDAVFSAFDTLEFEDLDLGPRWAEPCLIFNHKKNTVRISLTEEDEFDAVISWTAFEKSLLDMDSEEGTKQLVAKLEHFLKRAKSELKKYA